MTLYAVDALRGPREELDACAPGVAVIISLEKDK